MTAVVFSATLATVSSSLPSKADVSNVAKGAGEGRGVGGAGGNCVMSTSASGERGSAFFVAAISAVLAALSSRRAIVSAPSRFRSIAFLFCASAMAI